MRGILIPRRSLRPAGVASPPLDMLYWFDAADLTDADGTALTNWANQGTEGGNASQTLSSAKRPLVKTGILNGLRVVRFDGVDDRMITGTNTPPGVFQPLHYFVVANLTAFNAPAFQSLILDNGEQQGKTMWFGAFSSTTMGLYAGSGGISGTQSIPTGFHRWRLLYNGASSTMHKDDGASPFASGNVGNHELRGLTLGSSSAGPAGTSHAACDIAEVIVYSRVLSSTEITDVETYLQTKWGV